MLHQWQKCTNIICASSIDLWQEALWESEGCVFIELEAAEENFGCVTAYNTTMCPGKSGSEKVGCVYRRQTFITFRFIWIVLTKQEYVFSFHIICPEWNAKESFMNVPGIFIMTCYPYTRVCWWLSARMLSHQCLQCPQILQCCTEPLMWPLICMPETEMIKTIKNISISKRRVPEYFAKIKHYLKMYLYTYSKYDS